MPAWQRYDGHLYRSAGPALSDPAAIDRLLVLSGGYGVLEGRDLIGDYNRKMRSRDCPRGLLEHLLIDRAAQSRLDVVAFAGATTDYAKVLHRARWQLPRGRTAQLVTSGEFVAYRPCRVLLAWRFGPSWRCAVTIRKGQS